MTYKEPTSEECTSNAIVHEDDHVVARAVWYPQMGGYVGKAVVEFGKGCPGGCFDVWVWHDGAFPFSEDEGGSPAHIHHCMAEQFVEFGKKVEGWMSA